MIRIIKPNSATQSPLRGSLGIFLAGSIDNGTAEEWQAVVEQQIASVTATPLTIFNPRRDDWDTSLKQDISNPDFSYQVNWELDRLDEAHVVLFHFSPGGPAPITLMELGYIIGKHDPQDVFVSCPEGYWRRGNVQVMCSRAGIPVHDTLGNAVNAMIKELSL